MAAPDHAAFPHRARVRTIWAFTAALLFLGLLAAGCGRTSAGDAADGAVARMRVTCTTGMITDVVRRVVGDNADVEGIMREGVDPHLYKPTRADVVKLTQADIVFYNGLMLEGKMADLLARIGDGGKPVHAVTSGFADDDLIRHGGAHPDPHVWMDVRSWMRAVERVDEVLSQQDPSGATVYDANAAELLARMARLDEYARAAIGSIPEGSRALVTAHDAFSYFGRAYGIEVRGIQGISTESEAGIRDLNDLVAFIVDRGIGAVFVETSVAEKNVTALVEGARARGHEVRIGGSLFSDAMGAAGTWEGTYVGMIDHNVTTITRALGGNAPEGGFRAWIETRTGERTDGP